MLTDNIERGMAYMMLRVAAFLVALAAWSGVLLQAYVSIGEFLDQGGTIGDALWRLAGYFTVLTNILVAIAMSAVVLSCWPGGVKPSPPVLSAITLYILTVGVVYHILLRHVWSPEGLQKLADVILHYIVPLAMGAFWVMFVPKDELKLRHLPLWMIYPLAYCAYALMRGAQDGWYPYPFLDVTALGLERVLQNAAGLTAGFAIAGCLLVWLGRALARARKSIPA